MLKTQLKSLIRLPQTTIGPTVHPYNFLPNAVAIIDGSEILYKGQVIWLLKSRPMAIKKVVPL